MKKIKEKFYLASVSLTTLMLTTPTIAFADKKGDEVQKKLSDAIGTIQGVLTGLIVAVGIVVALWIIIKRLPSADDPKERSIQGIGTCRWIGGTRRSDCMDSSLALRIVHLIFFTYNCQNIGNKVIYQLY